MCRQIAVVVSSTDNNYTNILFSVFHNMICASVFYGKCKGETTLNDSCDPFAATKQNLVDVFGSL